MEKIISNSLKIIGIVVGLVLLYLVKDLVLYLLLAFVIAAAFRPGINFFEKKKVPRVLSGLFLFLLVLVIVGTIFWLLIPPLISDFQEFASENLSKDLPIYWEGVSEWVNQFEEWGITPVNEDIKQILSDPVKKISSALSQLVGSIYIVFGKILNIIFILIVAFYLSVEKNIGKNFSRFFKGRETQRKVYEFWKMAEEKAGRWLQGYLLLGVIVTALVYIGLSILGVKYSLLLGIIAGLLEIVPLLGPIFATVLGVIISFFQGGWTLALWALLIYFVIQQLENYVLVPWIMKRRVDLNPLLTIIVLFAGGRLAGVAGMILAVPVTTILLGTWNKIKTKDF